MLGGNFLPLRCGRRPLVNFVVNFDLAATEAYRPDFVLYLSHHDQVLRLPTSARDELAHARSRQCHAPTCQFGIEVSGPTSARFDRILDPLRG